MRTLSTEPDRQPATFEAVYRRLHPTLFRYLHRLIGDADVAEDVAQESFIRLLRRPELSEEGARCWLFTVATNLVRDRGRAASRHQRLLSVGNAPTPAPLPSPEEEVERAERVKEVRAALEQLAPRDRQLLLMREEGFRYEEIADAVGVAPGSVGTLIARALKRFASAYRPEEVNDDAR